MQKLQWKLGDPCFIADISVSETFARMAIMPATITHIGGTDGRTVVATAYSTEKYGPLFITGSPYRTEQEVRQELAAYTERVTKAVQGAEVRGTRPKVALPADLPSNGDIVYVIDAEAAEVLEAYVGIVQFDLGKLVIGYDQSPGNPEASNIRTTEWWQAKEDALRVSQERHGKVFAFVSKEELAARTDAAIDKIFDDALAFAKSPAGIASLANLFPPE